MNARLKGELHRSNPQAKETDRQAPTDSWIAVHTRMKAIRRARERYTSGTISDERATAQGAAHEPSHDPGRWA